MRHLYCIDKITLVALYEFLRNHEIKEEGNRDARLPKLGLFSFIAVRREEIREERKEGANIVGRKGARKKFAVVFHQKSSSVRSETHLNART